jgi:hypothetical protein
MAPRTTVVAASIAATLSLCFVQSAAAQVARPRADFSPAAIRAAASAAAPLGGARVEAKAADIERQRPSILMTSLYATTALVQGLDAHSTLKAIHVGATERNPMMSFLTSHPPVFVALKTGAAAGLIVAGRKLAKHSKLKAAIALIAIDSTYAVIVAHNYKVAARLR